MDFFVLLLVAGVVAWLYNRVERLEREVGDLARALDAQQDRASVRTPQPLGVERESTTTEAIAPEPVRPEPTPAARPTASIARVAAKPTIPDRAETAAAPAPQITESSFESGPTEKGFGFDFEEFFGRQLPIWAGGITLAVAGFFLVRYAIDVGLLSPAVRVALGLTFGVALLAGAEGAHRFRERVADPRVSQALAGAGLATLYASVFLAGTFYGLIGSATAFVGLALVTAGAIALSFRFGLPSAILGLIGGFAAPALVGSEEANLPLLAFYLALVAGGLGHAARKRGEGWRNGGWLGLAGLVGGLGWGGVMTVAQPGAPGDVVSLGLLLVLLGAVLPALVLPELRQSRWMRLAAGGVASLQMAVLLESSGYDLLSWGLYLLLGAALAGLGWQHRALREAAALAGGVGVWMIGFWFAPEPWLFTVVGAGLVAIFAGVPLFHLWRGTDGACGADIAALAVVPLGLTLTASWHFATGYDDVALPVGLAGLALAVLPALGAWRIGPDARWRSAVLEASAVLTGFAGMTHLLPADFLAWALALATVGITFGLPARRWALRTGCALALLWAAWPFGWWLGASLETLAGDPGAVTAFPPLRDMLLTLVPAVVAMSAFAWRFGKDAKATRRIPVLAAPMLALVLGIVCVHIAFKQLFAIGEGTVGTPGWHDFVTYGLAERTAWEALLLTAAVLAWMLRDRWSVLRDGAAVLAALSFAHFAWYTGVLHNPLWSAQAVGPTPVANLLVAAYGIGAAALLLTRQAAAVPERLAHTARVGVDAVLMVLIALFALSELRQVFAGTLLISTPVGQTEDLLRSLLGIVLAIGFLLWGARSNTRSWRIGSLVLMLAAVCKVFAYDTAGLEGLVRIASFMALGFSLIGIGWFYTRQLRGAGAKVGSATPA